MKNIFRLMILSVLAVILAACKETETDSVIGLSSNGSLTASTATVVLNETTATADAVAFTWIDPVFSVNVATKNYLQFGRKGNNFVTSQLFLLPEGVNTASITHLELNNLMAALGLAPNLSSQVEVRLLTELNTVTQYFSEAVSLSVTPYAPNPDLLYPKINVPGGYAGAAGYTNWEPTNSPNLYSPASNGKYRGFIYVTNPGSEFKFTINQDWAGDKGDNGTFTGILVEDGESNILAPTAGTYYLKVDWLGNTYSSELANLGIIGDATVGGWGADTDFVYNPSSKNWEIASIALNTAGVFKFRANDDWAMKFQPADADQTLTSGTGVMTFFSAENTVTGDPNYKVDVAGNYKIVLDLHNSAYYKLTLIKL